MYLNNIAKNKEYKIKKINANKEMKRRLYDIGMIAETNIKLLYISPSKRMKAYLVKNFIISIRDKDAKLIEVSND